MNTRGLIKKSGSSSLSVLDKEIDVLIRARYPIIYVVSWEEKRVLSQIQSIAEGYEDKKKVYSWTMTQGLIDLQNPDSEEASTEPVEALNHIMKSQENAIFVFLDLHPFMSGQSPNPVVRKLRDVAHNFEISYKTLVIVSPVLSIPTELEKDIVVIDYPLPDYERIERILDDCIERISGKPQFTIELGKDEKEQVIKSALGLTASEAQRVLGKAIVSDGKLDASDIALILKEKEQIIRKSGILEYFSSHEEFGSVGGLDLLKDWLRKRAGAFTEEARLYGLPEPKGLLLIGVPGCGKSLVAKAVAAEWNKPLLRLDIGRIFGGLVGASEENMRRAIKAAESISPVILWIDEIEKGLAGGQSGTDSGVTARVFGTFITWMQEKIQPVFVIATANNISQLPPELLRKGRFDDMFFIDLPSFHEREEIFRIHLRKRNRNPDDFDISEFARKTEDFSGSEIEQLVISSLYDAFAQKRTKDDGKSYLNQIIMENIGTATSLSVVMSQNIESMRKWAQARKALPASSTPSQKSMEAPRPPINPFPFKSGERARSVDTLLSLCIKYPQEASEYLYNGSIEKWLSSRK